MEEEKKEKSEVRGTEDESSSEEYEDVEDNENCNVQEEKIGQRKSTRAKQLSEKYRDYVFLTFQETITGPEKEEWKKAIKMEQQLLKENKTWKVIDNTEAKGKKILSSKWIFRTKEDGRKKARLVVRGFEQIHGIDFEETFSPVINNASLRTLFTLAVKKNYLLTPFDIKTAFLYGNWIKMCVYVSTRRLQL